MSPAPTLAPVVSLSPPVLDALIVGAGFSGMGMAIQLLRLGIRNILMVDKATEPGGAGLRRAAPGTAADSRTGAYSFEPRPPEQALQDYARHVAGHYGLRERMRLQTPVTQARFGESEEVWQVRLASGEIRCTRLLILATGDLPPPALPGLADFAGKILQAGDWDHDYPLEGRQAVVLGDSADAVRLIPVIAPRVRHLTVFQHTPPWVMPPLSPAVRAAFRHWADAPDTLRQALHHRTLEALCRLHLRAHMRQVAVVAGARRRAAQAATRVSPSAAGLSPPHQTGFQTGST